MTTLNKTIGFLGAGNMCEAFVGALINARIFSPAMIYIRDIIPDRMEFMTRTYGVTALESNAAAVSACDIIVLAVKPQQMDAVLEEISDPSVLGGADRKLIISIAAGVPIRKIEKALYARLDGDAGARLPVIRVMPNTPALVLCGMSGMSPNARAAEEDIRDARTILEAIGKVVLFDEEKLDAVTALSGSGPAYVFYLAESMREAGVRLGLDPDDAALLSARTLEGAVKLMVERGESPESLRKKVTSPGGTTEAALTVFERRGLKEIIIDGLAAAARRSEELSG